MHHNVPAAQVVPAVPAAQVDPVDSRTVQLVQAVPVVLAGPVVLAVPADPVIPVVQAVQVAVAPVHALARADQRPARSDGLEANLHVAVNPKGPSVKSLTTWKHPRWVVYVCLEEMATASDFHVVPA